MVEGSLENQMADDRSKPSKEDYQERLDKISSIFADMVKHADASSLTRCPYKNRFDQCTAKFRCRYQKRSGDAKAIACTSDDRLDYRTAWETDPEAALKMRDRLRGKDRGSE